MSREQSDQVALANDGHDLNKPFPDAAYKRWLASGAIVPPRDTGAPSGPWVAWFIIGFAVLCMAGFLYGVSFK